jgi:hypothetical protein
MLIIKYIFASLSLFAIYLIVNILTLRLISAMAEIIKTLKKEKSNDKRNSYRNGNC